MQKPTKVPKVTSQFSGMARKGASYHISASKVPQYDRLTNASQPQLLLTASFPPEAGIMVNQTQVFEEIQRKLGQRPSYSSEAAQKSEVTRMMKKLYHPSIEGERYFYSQAANDVPLKPIPTVLHGVASFCTIASTNVLNAEDWRSEPRPEGYIGQI
jgi:hypothetical protein